MHRVVVSWSSGKDAAWALEVLRAQADVEIVGLLTTVSEDSGRVGMHGTSAGVLTAQAEALDLPLELVELPWPATNQQYEQVVGEAIRRLARDGITHLAFGDLFLEDVRSYREDLIRATGVGAMFPLWGRDTGLLAGEMIRGGLDARLATVDASLLPSQWLGRAFDTDLLEGLPSTVDPCGERGEFHTVVVDAPSFRSAIPVTFAEPIEEAGFSCAAPRLGSSS